MNKRQLLIASGIGVLGAAAVSFFINNKKEERSHSTFENAGIPDQAENPDLAQLENAKMVSEGSQFGVQYYNHVQADLEDVK